MNSESIYNLIPKEYIQPPKQPLYKSKYPPNIPPSSSTFGHATTSIPKVSNVHGGYEEVHIAHKNKAPGATMGKLKGSLKPNTQQFTKKGTGTMGKIYTPSEQGSSFKYNESFKKPDVPRRDEKPIMGLKSGKNFIIANAVENMLSQPKIKEEPMRYTQKADYGKTPQYLKDIQTEIVREYEHIKAVHEAEEEEERLKGEKIKAKGGKGKKKITTTNTGRKKKNDDYDFFSDSDFKPKKEKAKPTKSNTTNYDTKDTTSKKDIKDKPSTQGAEPKSKTTKKSEPDNKENKAKDVQNKESSNTNNSSKNTPFNSSILKYLNKSSTTEITKSSSDDSTIPLSQRILMREQKGTYPHLFKLNYHRSDFTFQRGL